jgi:hypothetical protein
VPYSGSVTACDIAQVKVNCVDNMRLLPTCFEGLPYFE